MTSALRLRLILQNYGMASSGLGTSYVVLSGIVLIAVAVAFAVIRPLIGNIQTLQADIAQEEEQTKRREEFLRTLDSKISALASEAAHEQQLNVVLPEDEATEDVVRVIHQAGVASGGVVRHLNNVSAGVQSSLNAQRARGEAAALPDNISPLGFEVEFAGSYQQLRVFLNELQRAPRLLDIMSLEVQRSAQVPDSILATFTAQFYRYAENKE